jgi:hypothetical protein
MKASVGDRIVIKGHRIGEPDRDCVILGVRGPDGGPPYVVRWDDSGRESFFYPGSDASVVHYEHASKSEGPR